VRVGSLWRLTYAGVTSHVPDVKGIRDLASLLAEPGREFPALDLATAHGATGPRVAGARQEGLGRPGDLGERLDATARAAYTARIKELQEALDGADAAGDPHRAAAAQEELDFLTAELSAAYGLRGPRRSGDPAEKARAAVTSRIRAAIAKIRAAHPALGEHLGDRVKTGRFCSYQPATPTTWTVRRDASG
jgi:hypothetical protein